MNRIIFVINNLGTGGVQASFMNLLKEIHNKYQITVFCFDERLQNKAPDTLPKDIDFVTAHSPFRYLGISQAEAKIHPYWYIARAFFAVVTRLFGRSLAIRLMLPFPPRHADRTAS